MRKQTEDNYLNSLSQYNVVFYWHFIISSTIVLIVVYFVYKNIELYDEITDREFSHFNEDEIFDYANYILNVYEPYDVDTTSDKTISDEELVEKPENNNNYTNTQTSNSDATNNVLDDEKIYDTNQISNDNIKENSKENLNNVTNNGTYDAKNTNYHEKTNNFVKKQDNLDNTIEKNSEIVYNYISEENISNADDVIFTDMNSDVILKIIFDENNYTNNLNSSVVSENTSVSENSILAFKKLQLDYINNFYYNYIESYNSSDNAKFGDEAELSLYQIILLSKLLENKDNVEEISPNYGATENSVDTSNK